MSFRSTWTSVLVVVFAVAMAACAAGADSTEGLSPDEIRARCETVRCPMPLCAEGQHLTYQGSCCATCVGGGQPDHCAETLCPAIACAEGEMRVDNQGQCCPRCQPRPNPVECTTDSDCPQIYCFACPCPTSECQGRQCVTRTPDSSTCGGSL